MLIEDLMRLGKALLGGGMPPRDVLQLISDAESVKAKNFYQHVFVVEVDSGSDQAVALSMQVWGQRRPKSAKSKKMDFHPDIRRVCAAPFTLPQGGNPINAQGIYGVPVYPCYEAHLHAFAEGPEGVLGFLKGRLTRSPSFSPSEGLLRSIANEVHDAVCHMDGDDGEKLLGVLVIADIGDAEAAYSTGQGDTTADIGKSRLCEGQAIVPHFDRILDRFWLAKVQEGAELGEREGQCSFCREETTLVSPYCKAWPWLLPTWHCPIPHAGNDSYLVEGVALCPECYRALNVGARIFEKLSKRIHPEVTRELFAPTTTAPGRQLARRKSISDLPTIQGSAFVLPIVDSVLAEESSRTEFGELMSEMLSPPPDEARENITGHMKSVAGFEWYLPDGADPDDYRATLIYFSGDTSRGDVHLRAMVEDVIPTTMRALQQIVHEVARSAMDMAKAMGAEMSSKQADFYTSHYGSAPALLAQAYGGPYLWDNLRCVLRREPLDLGRHIHNAARRMESLVTQFPETRYQIRDEVIFYLTFMEFADLYASKLCPERRMPMPMRPWKDLLTMVDQAPIREIDIDDPSDLAFAIGCVLRKFSSQHYAVTNKDFLKQRVMTFGTSLDPEIVWKRGLSQIFDVAARYSDLSKNWMGKATRSQQLVGLLLATYDRLRRKVGEDKDAFMAAFWSGYALQGAGESGGEQPKEDE